MNLVSQGQGNIMLNSNPKTSFFKSSFRQYTNFGMQRFRIDFEGAKQLRLTEQSTFTFKVPRYADLLWDTYLSVTLPNIWSPIFPPQQVTQQTTDAGLGNVEQWAPYEFKWIENLGAKMIAKISIICGNYTLQEYSGDYLLAAVQRDFNGAKRRLFDRMTGHVPELMDPANADARVNAYPSAYYTPDFNKAAPSISGRTLYIPLNAWFGLNSQMAFPLTSLQYNELQIVVTFRPINQLFVIRDVMDATNNYPYVAPNFNTWYMQFHRFLVPPPDVALGIDSYVPPGAGIGWNADIHLVSTYCFLANAERNLFALNPQDYLIKQVVEKRFMDVVNTRTVDLDSLGMVIGWLFYFQRSDVNLRNQWSNYTNWPYDYLPLNVVPAPAEGDYTVYRSQGGELVPVEIGPGVNPDGNLTGIVITQPYSVQNQREILLALGILMDGDYRENMQPAGVYNYVEKYVRTSGDAPDGLYSYTFATRTNNADMQPHGAMSMSLYNQIQFNFATITPPTNPLAQSLTVCDPETGAVIGVNKTSWSIWAYTYDLVVFEERVNMVKFMGGNVGMLYAN